MDVKGDCGGSYNGVSYKLKRGSTDIYIADSSGSAGRASFGGFDRGSDGYQQNSFVSNYLDSPSSTSAITYSVAVFDANADGGTFYFNRNRNTNTSGNDSNSASSITVMEVSA